MEPLSKRRRLSVEDGEEDTIGTPGATGGSSTPHSLNHPVSPPRKRNRPTPRPTPAEDCKPHAEPASPEYSISQNRIFKSPFQLTWVRDLPDTANIDAVRLGDILGDPLIAECWNFNYLHDIDFILSHIDQDVRNLVELHIVHGFWKQEDESRLMLQVSLNWQTILLFHLPPKLSPPRADI